MGLVDGVVYSAKEKKWIEGKGICLCVCVLADRLIDRQDRKWVKAEWAGKNRWWFRFMNEHFRSIAIVCLVGVCSVARKGVHFSLSGKQAKA